MIVAGFGHRRGAGAESLADALRLACRAGAAPGLLAAPADKAHGPALRALAARLGLPLAVVPPEALRAAPTLTRSPASLKARGTGSVAEAAALATAAIHGEARLLGPRSLSSDRMASCALAEIFAKDPHP